MIGIVGGVGPLAGVDIVNKIIEETKASKDQEHIPVLLSSQPHRIADRTAFLLGKETVNPGIALAEIALELEKNGATVVAVPCNTAHAPLIFDKTKEIIAQQNSSIRLLHLVEETARFIRENHAGLKVGILSTTGTRNTGLYKNILADADIHCIEPDDDLQDSVHQAIYNESYGIKAFSSPVTRRAHDTLIEAVQTLKSEGAEMIVLACTELPLALKEKSYFGLPIVDPNRILARALIAHIDPNRLI